MRKFFIETLNLVFQAFVEMVVGSLWALASPILERHPGVLVAIPGLAEDRGAVYGSLAAKYSTMLYLGEVKNFKDMLKSKITTIGIALGFISGLYVVLIAGLFSNPLDPLLYLLVSRGLIVITLVPLTALLTQLAFEKGLDVDLVVVSVVTVIADLLSAVSIFLTFNVLGVPFAVLAIALALYSFKAVGVPKEKPEYAVSVIVASTMSTLAGLSLAAGGAASNPQLLTVTPMIMAINGSASMNFASWLGTALALGVVRPDKPFNKELMRVWLRVTCEVLIALTVVSLAWRAPLATVIVTTLLLRAIMPAIATLVASLSFKKGWDPDLITIPFLSSLNDLVSANLLLAVFALLH